MSCARGHVGGKYVVRVPVEVRSGLVVAHGRAWVGMAGGDPNIAQADSRIEHGGHECVPQHVRMHSRQPRPGAVCQLPQAAGCAMVVHSSAASVQQNGAAHAVPARSVECARLTAGGSGTRTTLVPLPATRRTRCSCSSPRSTMSDQKVGGRKRHIATDTMGLLPAVVTAASP